MNIFIEYLNVFIFIALLFLGYIVGQWNEKRHFKSIRKREGKYKELLTYSTRNIPDISAGVECELVMGSVVVSIDYFKKVAAALRSIFGGKVISYESLLDRGRREAMLRMKENTEKKGGKAIFNVKMETASIYKGAKNQIGSVEVFCYGTAVIPH